MDVSTFYALFSATCFTLVGLWWTVVERNRPWLRDPATRRRVGAIYQVMSYRHSKIAVRSSAADSRGGSARGDWSAVPRRSRYPRQSATAATRWFAV